MSEPLHARILVIEDEPMVRELVTMNLQHAGHDVSEAATFAEGFALAVHNNHDVAVVDVMLPDGDGMNLVSQLRSAGVRMPVLMLTARNAVVDKVKGLSSGADDYLTKPFDVLELLARIDALLRRSKPIVATTTAARLELGAWWIRLDNGEALTREGLLVLSEKELALMRTFLVHENRALSRAELLEEVWGMDRSPTDRTVDNFIVRLRRLFEDDPEQPSRFVTLRGRGYLFRRSPT
jgi:two-component system, OmpR family, alkaline phosphatase synthesis response regulator PhoP